MIFDSFGIKLLCPANTRLGPGQPNIVAVGNVIKPGGTLVRRYHPGL